MLGRTASVLLHEVRCSETSRAAGEEEEEGVFSVNVPLAGLYVHKYGRLSLVGAPGLALLMNRGDVHRTAHPAAGGDRSLEIVLSDRVAEPFTRARTDRFPRRAVRVPLDVDRGVRQLARAASSGDATSLELDGRVDWCLSRFLGSVPVGPLSAHQHATVDAALEYLAWHFTEDGDLPSVAAAVGTSPHHLSRLFHAGTGITLSGYRTELRVRAAVERLSNGASDLSSVACDVGFFDHAHMTRTFRRLLGRTPTDIRCGLSRSELEDGPRRRLP